MDIQNSLWSNLDNSGDQGHSQVADENTTFILISRNKRDQNLYELQKHKMKA